MSEGSGASSRAGIFSLVLVFCLVTCAGRSSPTAQDAEPPPSQLATQPEFPRVSNHIILYSKATKASQPYTVSRVFAQGEFPKYVAASVNGTKIPTQCNVKSRWPDGSIKHALLSFWAVVATSQGLRVEFVPVDQPSSEGGLSATQMLSGDFDFSAQMELTSNGVRKVIDARQMLEGGAFRYWLRGPICTQVIIEDRTPELRFDVSWQSGESFHPTFVATFYPGWRGVKVEFIGENAWTTRLRPLSYSLRLLAGPPSAPQTVYTKNTFTHYTRTRWRKVFWSGPQPEVERIDYNLPYLIYSRVVPNFDTSVRLSSSAVDEEWSSFEQTDRGDINGSGQWTKYFPTTGGRPEIGLFPRWAVRYLYSFDKRLLEVLLGNAAVSGHVPIHYRESKPNLPYLKDSGVEAFGRPLSADARPTFWSMRLDWPSTRPEDRVAPPADIADSQWTPDLAHQGSFAYIPYLITGDWYFLEELYFWAAYTLTNSDPNPVVSYGRHEDWAIISTALETRGVAWGLRTAAHAAFFAPDGTPEQEYFRRKLENNIAVKEGELNIRHGSFYDPSPDSRWSWGRNVVGGNADNPLHFWDWYSGNKPEQEQEFDLNYSNPCRAEGLTNPWQLNFVHVVLGHMEELGFPVAAIREHVALNLINMILHPSANPYLAVGYRMPLVQASTGKFYQDWECLYRAYKPEVYARREWPAGVLYDGDHDYALILRAALSFVTLFRTENPSFSGEDAWLWISSNLQLGSIPSRNPKWVIVPRAFKLGRGKGDSQPPRQTRQLDRAR